MAHLSCRWRRHDLVSATGGTPELEDKDPVRGRVALDLDLDPLYGPPPPPITKVLRPGAIREPCCSVVPRALPVLSTSATGTDLSISGEKEEQQEEEEF